MASSGIVQRAVTAFLDRHPMPALAVGMICTGADPVIHTFGFADVERGVPLDEHGVFRISSMSKVLTTVALMRLRERGLLELDRPVNAYLRALKVVPPRFGQSPITIAQLLTHTSGIPPWGNRRATRYRRQPRPESLAEVYGGVLVARSQPGHAYAYSNHNFALLGQVIEDVTGEPFERHIASQVLAPLGMRDTSYGANGRDVVGYGRDTTGRLRPTVAPVTPLVAACEARSSIADLLRLAGALLPGRPHTVVAEESQRMMLSAQFRLHPGLAGAGLCFGVREIAGEPLAHLNAFSPMYSGTIQLLPERGAAVVLLASLSALHALDLLADVLLRLTQKLVPPAAELTELPADLHRSHWPDLEGRYAHVRAHDRDPASPAESYVRVQAQERGLYLTVDIPNTGRQRVRLAPTSRSEPTIFQTPPGELDLGPGQSPCAIAFLRDGSGAIDRLCVHSFVTFCRIRPAGRLGKFLGIVSALCRRGLDRATAAMWPCVLTFDGRTPAPPRKRDGVPAANSPTATPFGR